MLKSQRKPKTKDEIMIVNNYHLMKKAVELKNTPLSVEMILDLHRIATSNAIENKADPGNSGGTTKSLSPITTATACTNHRHTGRFIR